MCLTIKAMPIHKADVEFWICDRATLVFIEHCFDYWRDETVCTNAHVSFMKYLVRHVFGLPPHVQLVGIRFGDETLAMVSPLRARGPFFVLSRGDGSWKAMRVWVDGFTPQWGLETGFWEGLNMGQHTIAGVENVGPQEDGD